MYYCIASPLSGRPYYKFFTSSVPQGLSLYSSSYHMSRERKKIFLVDLQKRLFCWSRLRGCFDDWNHISCRIFEFVKLPPKNGPNQGWAGRVTGQNSCCLHFFYTFDQKTFSLPAIISSNGCEIRVSWPQFPIIWHQAVAILLM